MFHRFARVAFPSLVLTALVGAALAGPVAAGATRYVDDDGTAGPSSCDGSNNVPRTIQAGIALAHRGDTVIVCPGDYTGPITIGKRRLKVRADHSGNAYLMPKAGQAAGVPLVTIKHAAYAELSGFNLRFPTDVPCVGLYYGILVKHSSHALILDNSLSATGTDTEGTCQYGLAIKVEQHSYNARIVGNTMTDFGYGGIDFTNSPRVVVRSNTLNFTHADVSSCSCSGSFGIAMDVSSFNARAIDNTVRGSTNPLVVLGEGIEVRDVNETVSGNSVSRAGIGIDVQTRSTGSTVSGNQVELSSSVGIQLNCTHDNTISGNTSTTSNFGILVDSCSSGNVLSGNTATGNTGTDCEDQTWDFDQPALGNTWSNNTGVTTYPSATDYQPPICEPPAP